MVVSSLSEGHWKVTNSPSYLLPTWKNDRGTKGQQCDALLLKPCTQGLQRGSFLKLTDRILIKWKEQKSEPRRVKSLTCISVFRSKKHRVCINPVDLQKKLAKKPSITSECLCKDWIWCSSSFKVQTLGTHRPKNIWVGETGDLCVHYMTEGKNPESIA